MTAPPTEPKSVPPGFGPIFRTSPVLDALGGFFSRGSGPTLEIGLLVGERHVNSRGSLHGGVIATLADTGVGYLLAYATEPPRRIVTARLTVDYVAPGALGEWLDVKLDATRDEGRHVDADARIVAGERVVARVEARFVVPGRT